jgi:hypothetical protein
VGSADLPGVAAKRLEEFVGKLAATIRGDAPVGLRDSYSSERHPVGAQVLDWSRAQFALMRPIPHARSKPSSVISGATKITHADELAIA